MCHYSLSWAKDEKPDRQEMRRAAAESLKALGMELGELERRIKREQLAKDCRGVLGRFRAELEARQRWEGFRWGKHIRKRCGRSRVRREKSTVAAWKVQRNRRGRRS